MSTIALEAPGEALGRAVGTWLGRAVGSVLGGPIGGWVGGVVGSRAGAMAGRAAAGALANMMEEADEAAETETKAEAPDVACATCEPPNRRHDPCRTKKNDPTKDNNTVWDPEIEQQVRNEIGKIQRGEVPKVNGDWTINGRTYGRHNNSIFPKNGTGFTNLSRMEHQFLKQLNGKSYADAMKAAENLKAKGILTQEQIDKVLELWKKCGTSLGTEMPAKTQGIDIYIGKGVDRERLIKALTSATPIESAAIADYEDEASADVILFGKWAWLHSLESSTTFSWKIDLEINEPTDFAPIIKEFQRILGVKIAIPDEQSPLPNDLIMFSIDGSVGRFSVPEIDR